MARLGTVGKTYWGAKKGFLSNFTQEGRYMKKEDQDYQNLYNWLGIPGPQEQELTQAQFEAIKQAREDRLATIKLILAQLGYKQVGNSLVPLTREERRNIMSKAEQYRADAQEAYQGRAMAAAKGETKLPSFLKKNIDAQKMKEEALLSEILGEDVVKSTAGQQAIAAMKKKEEDVRQKLQEQDLATTPQMAAGLSGQAASRRQGLIGAYEALPGMNENLIRTRAGIIGQLQDWRTSLLRQKLGEIENKRQMIQNLYTLGGQFGGAAAAYASNRKKDVNDQKVDSATTDYSGMGSLSYGSGGYESNPNEERPWFNSDDYLSSR